MGTKFDLWVSVGGLGSEWYVDLERGGSTSGWSVWDPVVTDECAVGVRKEAGRPQIGLRVSNCISFILGVEVKMSLPGINSGTT